MDFSKMGKDELRKACRENGISYGKLNNDGMRAALAAKLGPTETTKAAAQDAKLEFVTAQGQPLDTVKNEAPVSKPNPPKSTSKPGVRTIEKNREERNGIKRPSAGTVCRAVWDALDKVGIENATSATAKALSEKNGWNKNNVSIEFYQWRRFHGIEGRQPKKPASK